MQQDDYRDRCFEIIRDSKEKVVDLIAKKTGLSRNQCYGILDEYILSIAFSSIYFRFIDFDFKKEKKDDVQK